MGGTTVVTTDLGGPNAYNNNRGPTIVAATPVGPTYVANNLGAAVGAGIGTGLGQALG
jgi:hypothetical protein